MALTTTNLQRVSAGHSSLPALWTYLTDEDITDVDAANYWGTSLAEMKAGDFVFCTCADGGVMLIVSALDLAAGTSTASAVGSGGNGGQVWVGPIRCTVLETAGTVGVFVAPITGTVSSWYTVTTEVIDTTDAILNL